MILMEMKMGMVTTMIENASDDQGRKDYFDRKIFKSRLFLRKKIATMKIRNSIL